MKPSLHLKLSQQLAMTPQLQQAIRLLQLSTLDLRQEIQDALESNPLLDIDESDEFEKEAEPTNDTKKDEELNLADSSSEIEPSDSSELMEQSKIENDLEIDASWEDFYSANTGHTGIASDDDMPVYQGETTTNLYSHLSWQLELTPFSELDRSIGTAIIDGIDEYGYLTVPLSDICESVGNGKVKIEDIEIVLKRIQQFEPLGVASRNLQECLLIQLATLPADEPWLAEATQVLTDHIDDLGNRDYKKITRATKLKEPQLREVLKLIQRLNPRPGSQLDSNSSAYIIPDVSVVKEKGVWSVYINSDSVPRLRVHPYYSSFSKGNSPDNQFIRSNLQEAKWLIKSIESRNDTLLKVAKCIVEQQQDFFEYGEEAMKPMILSDIALAVEMHESTISRVTTQKFMHTPRGIFELKYFFSSHVNTESGGECSSTVIRALIKKLVAGESPSKPLSDSKITSLLAEQGIKVARRTIAKYRESLNIAPSNQRKRLL